MEFGVVSPTHREHVVLFSFAAAINYLRTVKIVLGCDWELTLGGRYQYLNHYLIFCGGYKDDAMDVMNGLVQKYAGCDNL